MWEFTPHSGGYFLTQDTYSPNGVVGAVTAALGTSSIGISSLTFGLDGEGRPYSATETAHNLVTATTYSPASAPTLITYGNSDTDGFIYDPYTYRPTTLTNTIVPSTGSYNVTSSLTWNPNGSLQQFQYTDGSPSPLSQTCTYQADDLSRIASVDCGSNAIWGQKFAYDPFGNIDKTVPSGGTGSAYTAAYSTATNQVSSGITPAPTYDANGNQKTRAF
jgi:hypothetical protein